MIASLSESHHVHHDTAQRIDTTLAGDPEVLAELHFAMGMAYQSFRDPARAREHILASLEIRRELFGESDMVVVESLHGLGVLLHYEFGDHAGAEKAHLDALRIRAAIVGEESVEHFRLLDRLATLLLNSGRDADALFRQSLAIAARNGYFEGRDSFHAILDTYRRALHEKKRFEEEIDLVKWAIVVQEENQGRVDSASDLHVRLGDAARALDRLDEAERAYRDAVEIRRRNDAMSARPRLATALRRLAEVLGKTGKFGECRQVVAELLALQEKILGPEHDEVRRIREILEQLGGSE